MCLTCNKNEATRGEVCDDCYNKYIKAKQEMNKK